MCCRLNGLIKAIKEIQSKGISEVNGSNLKSCNIIDETYDSGLDTLLFIIKSSDTRSGAITYALYIKKRRT